MKIFFDHKIFVNQNYGGPSRYFLNLVKNLNYIENVNAKIFAPLHINKHLSSHNTNDKHFSHKIFLAEKISNYNFFKKKLMTVNNIINRHLINKFKPDILHTTYYNDDLFSKNIKFVVTVYDLIHEIFQNEYGYIKEIYNKKKILERADHIICISESTKNDLINYYNIPIEKISVVYLGMNLTYNSQKSKIFSNTLIKKNFFLYVGKRNKYKNFYGLLEALNLNKKIFINHQLVLFGGGKITNDEIKKILDLNLDPKNIIQLNGDDNLLKTLYQNSEFFIYPSKYEGFGIPILESFSQHCPVLCSNTSSFPEVAGNAAIYFDPNDYSSISECIDKIISSKKIKDYYIKKGLDRLKLFSWKKCAVETKNIYNNLF